MGTSRVPSFKDLLVWQKAMKLVERIYEATRRYPDDERYGLSSETRKTARSVVYNIAEGKMRISPREFRQFVSISLGSLGELHTQVILARQLKYLSEENGLEPEIEEVGRMLRGLEQSLA